jgi:hypothetical protein
MIAVRSYQDTPCFRNGQSAKIKECDADFQRENDKFLFPE